MPAVLLGLITIAALLAPAIQPYDPQDLTAGIPLDPPSPEHWFGVDDFGRDQLSRILDGARISLSISGIVAAVSMAVGTPIGLFLGYRRGRLDFVVGRLLDVMFAFPGLLLALVLATALGPGLTTATIAMCIIFTPLAIRFVRGVVASESVSDYVVAARIVGASSVRIAFRHLLPNIKSQLFVIATLIMSFAVLTEAALSFLGVGAQPPSASWGRMITDGRAYITTQPFLALIPALAIAVLVLLLNTLGDGLRDRLDSDSKNINQGVTAV
ncbi:ABC transporter permease [Amycolatopsis dongchuanensis]|uniref:ABC transporter permease n=1 Tax=Amycolatopsis dongchuanensis TaxID=1070866 RepID=A0ABP8VIJ7_9PSEU